MTEDLLGRDLALRDQLTDKGVIRSQLLQHLASRVIHTAVAYMRDICPVPFDEGTCNGSAKVSGIERVIFAVLVDHLIGFLDRSSHRSPPALLLGWILGAWRLDQRV